MKIFHYLNQLQINYIQQLIKLNFMKKRKNAEKEELLRKTIEVLRSKLKQEEIKEYFIKTTRDYFNADRCLFVDYDRQS